MISLLVFTLTFFAGLAVLGAVSSFFSPAYVARLKSLVGQLRTWIPILDRGRHFAIAKTAADDQVRIFSRYELEAEYGLGTWQRQIYDELIEILTADTHGGKTFPCVYATKGWKASEHRYVFAQSDDPSEPRNVRIIGTALRNYLKISHSCGPNTTLVVLCPPSPVVKSVEQYNLDFWAFLHGLRCSDTKPWPKEIPEDTLHNRWAFCFDGVPWFPAALTPAHKARHSRFTPSLVYVMQPKWIFDILFSTQKKRFGACEKVRALVKDFDEVDISPDVAHYGEPGTTESRQYYLYDVNERSYCPYKDLI